jgi:GNAT superfamily N-acetyltransferase
MEIRPATEADVPSIVSLLKSSLGESLMPKSERYWQWKHQENPFGESPVLLALEGGELVGVRAFMQWRWTLNNTGYKAVRAVDTATHPDHQGKGIFKKLTLGLVEECRSKGFNFVFNTPNSQSKPGYLKMGWKEAGKFPIAIEIKRPFGLLAHLAKLQVAALPPPDQTVVKCVEHSGLEGLLSAHASVNQNKIITDHDVASLRWRYQTVPVVSYHACTISRGNDVHGAAFFRFKATKIGLEMRVADLFLSSAAFGGEMRELLQAEAVKHKAAYLSIASLHDSFKLGGLLSLKKLEIGPIVTIRDIQSSPEQSLVDFYRWNASMGDLELF